MRRLAVLVAAVAALATAGCGMETLGGTDSGASLLVTQSFGTKTTLDSSDPAYKQSDSVLQMLERNTEIAKGSGGRTVLGIDGSRAVESHSGWFFYVNGLRTDTTAKATRLHGGDAVWWDLHARGTAISAVVGQFPEPFLHGIDGKRLPVRVECPDPGAPRCKQVRDVLVRAGVPASRSRLAAQLERETLRVMVGPWSSIGGDRAARQLALDPTISGVFARFTGDRRRLQLLDAKGRVRRTLAAGAGLVAATRVEDEPAVWVVTGTDDAGVANAAAAFDEATLRGNSAIAVAPDATGIALPVR
jgi:hypothetical protein